MTMGPFSRLIGPYGYAAQGKHVEHVGHVQLVAEGEAHRVHEAEGGVRFKGKEGKSRAPQMLFHVEPGREAALAPYPVHAVEGS